MNWNFRICGIYCNIERKDSGEYKIYIKQKYKNKEFKTILWLPGDKEFDFFVEQFNNIQMEVSYEKLKEFWEKERKRNGKSI